MVTTEERISRLEGTYEQVDERLGHLTSSIDALRADMNILRSDMNTMRTDIDTKLDALRSETNAKLNTMTIAIVTIGAAGIAALAGIGTAIVMLALRI